MHELMRKASEMGTASTVYATHEALPYVTVGVHGATAADYHALTAEGAAFSSLRERENTRWVEATFNSIDKLSLFLTPEAIAELGLVE